MKLRYYKLLTVLLFLDVLAIIFFLTIGNFLVTIVCASLAVLILITQVLLVKCPHCGARPGLWILAIWTLLLDFELYLGDSLLLRECPKCGAQLNERTLIH